MVKEIIIRIEDLETKCWFITTEKEYINAMGRIAKCNLHFCNHKIKLSHNGFINTFRKIFNYRKLNKKEKIIKWNM